MGKELRHIVLVFIFGMVLPIILIFFLLRYANNKITGQVTEMRSQIGEKVSVSGDTLQIIDFSFWRYSYTLEDGREIGAEFYNKNKVKPIK